MTIDNDIPTHAPGSVRALIGELAQLEDAIRRASTYVSRSVNGPVLNPQLLDLIKREAEVVAALRARRSPSALPVRPQSHDDFPGTVQLP
ncbi:hypothetical protein [Flexivirga alba]|jgi:hypothetical protein|uniref:Uncharacterized protein n=1 Tax=Flexivirga alba TaxID=702742 RepID=A0ABW2AJM7_9MICO